MCIAESVKDTAEKYKAQRGSVFFETARLFYFPTMTRTEKEIREAILEQTARFRKLKVKPEIKEATSELVSLKEEYKTVTGREWSDLREEGPILLSTNKVRGREVLSEFREMVKQLHRGNFIR